MGLLPVPERVLAPGLLVGARRRGSGALLGGAFAVCAAPCIGSVLGAVLVLASTSGTVLKGTVLLLRTRSASEPRSSSRASPSRVRWARSAGSVTATRIQVASGIVLVALGLLLFFHREWWLQVAVNPPPDDLGLAKPRCSVHAASNLPALATILLCGVELFIGGSSMRSCLAIVSSQSTTRRIRSSCSRTSRASTRRRSRTRIRTSRSSASRTTPTPPGCAPHTPPASTRCSPSRRSATSGAVVAELRSGTLRLAAQPLGDLQ